MDAKLYLNRYRLYVDAIGLPLVIRRSAGEATFKALDTHEKKDAALQVVPVTALRTVVREQLEAEARAAQQINHINIPVLHDFGFEDGQIVYVTEYFDGTTADEWVRKHGPLPVGAVLRIAQQVVNASSVATFHGIVHHAISPGNLMLVPGQTTDGEWPLIKVLNFVGVAPNLTPSEAPDPESAEPVNFASPEQIQSGAVDFRSQMYSLGATLWFLLTGRAPVGGAVAVENVGRVPLAVRRLLAQMLAADPSERPLDPLALQAQIRECVAQLDRRDAVASKLGLARVSETAATTPAAATRQIAWKPLALAATLLFAAVITAVVLAARSRQEQAIGVPIGVPENTVATAALSPAASAPAVANQPPPPPVAPRATTPLPAASEPPVLTAAAGAASELETSAEPDISPEPVAEEPALIAAAPSDSASPPTEASPVESTPLLASNTAPSNAVEEPLPPSEGPSEETIAAPAAAPEATATEVAPAAAIASNTPRPEQTLTRVPAVREEPRKTANAEKRERATTATKATRRSNRKSRIAAAENELPPVPRGSVRAQFLGTTPDGELVFGLPSEERVYARPPRAVRPPPPSRAQPAERDARELIEDLPVLPALPPDE